MLKRRRWSSFVSIVSILAGTALLSGCTDEGEAATAQQEAPPAMPVTVILPESREITERRDYLGRFDVLDRVVLRPRVTGYISKIRFKDGQDVRKGESLFVIDQRPFKLALTQAKAELEAAEAAQALAQSEYDRGVELRKLKALSQEIMDQRAQALLANDARLAQAKVGLKQAQLDMDYSVVKSPIDGRIGSRQVSVGNLVQAGGDALATIVATQPMYFNFELNEQDALRYQALLDQSEVASSVEVSLSGHADSSLPAEFEFMDVEADRSTGTIAARVVLQDSHLSIRPGMFGRVDIPLGTPRRAFLVPDTLIASNQNLKTLMVVDDQNMVTVKPVETGGLINGKRIVWSGIEADEKIIGNGIQKLRPGMPVSPQLQQEESPEAAAGAE